jgi:hypothetical protein
LGALFEPCQARRQNWRYKTLRLVKVLEYSAK